MFNHRDTEKIKLTHKNKSLGTCYKEFALYFERPLFVLNAASYLLEEFGSRFKTVLFSVYRGLLKHRFFILSANHMITFRAGIDLIAVDYL
jgi:hypothetical protein